MKVRRRFIPQSYVKAFSGYTATTNYNTAVWTKHPVTPCTVTGVNIYMRPGSTTLLSNTVRLVAIPDKLIYTTTARATGWIELRSWEAARAVAFRDRFRLDVPSEGYKLGVIAYEATVLSKALGAVITVLPWVDGRPPQLSPAKVSNRTVLQIPLFTNPINAYSVRVVGPITKPFVLEEVTHWMAFGTTSPWDVKVLVGPGGDQFDTTLATDPRIALAGTNILSPCEVVTGTFMGVDDLDVFFNNIPFRPYTNVRFKPAYVKLLARGSTSARTLMATFTIRYLAEPPWWTRWKGVK